MSLNRIFILLTIYFICLISDVKAQTKYPPNIKGANKIIYKTVDGVKLNLWVFSPKKHKSIEKSAAIVFFYGGGWNGGSPTQFVMQSKYFASRGMVAIVADYRVKSRHGVTAKYCVLDAKSAIRWVRENATKLGIDENKIAASGGSAGGHLAAACATLPKFDAKNENKLISSKPNALILFNPGLLLPLNEKMEKRLGTKPENLSPFSNISYNLPPTIIFHGTNDKITPFVSSELFTKKMHEFNNECTLVDYQGQGHGFFNYGRNSNKFYDDTINKMDKFLVSLGYLK